MAVYNATMCRVCLQDYRNDFECIFVHEDIPSELSNLGQLYEELFHLSICYEPNSPQYMCNYCSLQLKLFHKFKTKALESYQKFSLIVPKTKGIVENFPIKEEFSEENENVRDECNSVSDEELMHDEEKQSIQLDSSETEEFCFPEEDHVNYDEFIDIQYLEDDIDNDNNDVDLEDGKNKKEKLRQTRTSKNSYSCKDCNEIFDKKAKLLEHRSKQDKRLNYKCALCPKGFLIEEFPKSDMRPHQWLTAFESTRHKRANFSCGQCSKKFRLNELLQAHLKTHEGLPAYQCDFCSKSFKQKVHYINHINGHKNVRNSQCNLCGKAFLTKSDLKIHLRMHTDERRYTCDICNKKFRAYSHMTNHRYTHFGKTLECVFCQQMYTTPATLKMHVQSVHQNLCPFSCTVCKKFFKRKHHLAAHMNIHLTKSTENANNIDNNC